MISPRWIASVDWKNEKVNIGLSRKEIKDSPEYDDSSIIDRDYEERLHRHYGQTGYWNG
jgi:stress response protein YsnF